MSFLFGGLIIKKADDVSNNDILALLKKENYMHQSDITVDAATSREFDGVGMTRKGDTVLVFGRDIPLSCSFAPDQPLKLNDRLSNLSKQREILCYLLNGTAGTYAWAIFKDGKMIRAKSASGGELLSDIGQESTYDKGIEMSEKGLFRLLENFTGSPFGKLLDEKKPVVKVYDK